MFDWLWQFFNHIMTGFLEPFFSYIYQTIVVRNFELNLPEYVRNLLSVISDVFRIGFGISGIQPAVMRAILTWIIIKFLITISVNVLKLIVRWYNAIKI